MDNSVVITKEEAIKIVLDFRRKDAYKVEREMVFLFKQIREVAEKGQVNIEVPFKEVYPCSLIQQLIEEQGFRVSVNHTSNVWYIDWGF